MNIKLTSEFPKGILGQLRKGESLRKGFKRHAQLLRDKKNAKINKLYEQTIDMRKSTSAQIIEKQNEIIDKQNEIIDAINKLQSLTRQFDGEVLE